jgi:cyclic pyranopterin monophosphate synthase
MSDNNKNTPLNHFNALGQAHMVNVGDKIESARLAIATGAIQMLPKTLARLSAGEAAKGDVLGVARLAAIQGAKKTADLIPLAHPISLTHVEVDFVLDAQSSTLVLPSQGCYCGAYWCRNGSNDSGECRATHGL